MSTEWSRRGFVKTLSGAAAGMAVAPLTLRRAVAQAAQGGPARRPVADVVPARVHFFPMTQVRLRDGIFMDMMRTNRAYVLSLPNERLVHMFRVTAGIPSSAEPYPDTSWEAPKVELRGHFTGGHYLSACALLYASTGDEEVKAKGDALVAMMAECQKKNGDGYLSAFPEELFDHLREGVPVWAPFYTLHKIMAGLLDMYTYCGNQQALEMDVALAGWVSRWTGILSDPLMQRVLNEEYGGMGEVLYNLYAATGNRSYLNLGHRFDKRIFFDPLAAQRDELKGLHANTHIPQVIGAARAYELTGDDRSRLIAGYFWNEIVTQRSYCTGGTSNDEHWEEDTGHLNLSSSSEECCCGYNMLKLTRHIYGWNGDSRAMDYYERTLFNSRLGTQDKDGNLMYFLGLSPSVWKTFGTHDASFWCCTGTGIEEYSKLVDSIYAHDDNSLYVNLYIASDLNWSEKGIQVRQETQFPRQQGTTLTINVARSTAIEINLRIPYWVASGGSVKVNGETVPAFAGPGGYLQLSRTWQSGDKIELNLPMALHNAPLPGQPALQAAMYGPVVLAARQGSDGLTPQMISNHEGAPARSNLAPFELTAANGEVISAIEPADSPLQFKLKGPTSALDIAPLYQLSGERYEVYVNVNRPAPVGGRRGA